MKFNKRTFVIISILLILFVISWIHLSPERALRVYVTMMGYPIEAWQSELIEVPLAVSQYAELEHNETLYELSQPPIEKATEGELRYFAVVKIGLFYQPYFFGNF